MGHEDLDPAACKIEQSEGSETCPQTWWPGGWGTPKGTERESYSCHHPHHIQNSTVLTKANLELSPRTKTEAGTTTMSCATESTA